MGLFRRLSLPLLMAFLSILSSADSRQVLSLLSRARLHLFGQHIQSKYPNKRCGERLCAAAPLHPALTAFLPPRPLALCRVWVYTLVAADYDGAALFPHFINYYRQLGIPYRRFLVMVHHTPGRYTRRGLDHVAGQCMSFSIECRVWEGLFSSEAHLERMLGMLGDYVFDPEDWIVMADNDEFQDWGGLKLP
jgi:hypothetical protein